MSPTNALVSGNLTCSKKGEKGAMETTEKFVDAHGTRTYYLEAGEGPYLVLLHGGGIGIDARLTWHRNIEPLSEHFRVVAFDQLGFGKTDVPDDPSLFTRLNRAKHAIDLLDVLGISQAVLVGHSEGGLIASKIALEQPGRVSKLVIVTSGNTAPRLGGQRDEAWMRASKDTYNWELASASVEAFIDNFKQRMLFHPERVDNELLRTNYYHAERSGNMHNFLNLPPEESEPERYYALAQRLIYPHLPRLKAETLLIWANDDPTVPVERGLRLMEMIPNAEMHIFNHAKHMVMIDASDGFNRLVCGLR